MEDYRTGAMGAILDEYERALNKIVELVKPVTQENYTKIMDEETEDIDCKSIETIINHVVNAGYGYSFYIRKRANQDVTRKYVEIQSVDEIAEKATTMFDYVVDTSESLDFDLSDDKNWMDFIFRAPWAGIYDLEQILEHAIVHILRHRRQVEKFILRQQ